MDRPRLLRQPALVSPRDAAADATCRQGRRHPRADASFRRDRVLRGVRAGGGAPHEREDRLHRDAANSLCGRGRRAGHVFLPRFARSRARGPSGRGARLRRRAWRRQHSASNGRIPRAVRHGDQRASLAPLARQDRGVPRGGGRRSVLLAGRVLVAGEQRERAHGASRSECVPAARGSHGGAHRRLRRHRRDQSAHRDGRRRGRRVVPDRRRHASTRDHARIPGGGRAERRGVPVERGAGGDRARRRSHHCRRHGEGAMRRAWS